MISQKHSISSPKKFHKCWLVLCSSATFKQEQQKPIKQLSNEKTLPTKATPSNYKLQLPPSLCFFRIPSPLATVD